VVVAVANYGQLWQQESNCNVSVQADTPNDSDIPSLFTVTN